jgi:hypothetical protein
VCWLVNEVGVELLATKTIEDSCLLPTRLAIRGINHARKN